MNNVNHPDYSEELEVLIRLPYKTGVPLWAIAKDIYDSTSKWIKVREIVRKWRESGYDIRSYKDGSYDTCACIHSYGGIDKQIKARANAYYHALYANEFLPRPLEKINTPPKFTYKIISHSTRSDAVIMNSKEKAKLTAAHNKRDIEIFKEPEQLG